MADKIYVRDLELLLKLRGTIGKFVLEVSRALDQARRGILDSQARVRNRWTYWETELRRRQRAYEACCQDEDAQCDAEAAAVREAQAALEKLRRLSARLEQAIGEYSPYASRVEQLITRELSQARSQLDSDINRYQAYLASASRGPAWWAGHLPGKGGHRTHGYQYQVERLKFILNKLKEDPALSDWSADMRGHFKTQVRQRGEHAYLRSPKGIHVGHRYPGWNHWSNFRLEEAGMNQWRGGAQKR